MPSPAFDRVVAALLVDMDGTILNSVAAAERAWITWARSHGIDPNSFLSSIHGVQAVESVRRLGRPDLDPVREAAILTELELADVEGVESISGAREFFARLPADRWALVTSAPRALAERRMGAAGFPPPSVIVAAEDMPRSKPAPDGFLLAASHLGVDARHCLAFEDSAAGIAAAEAAGSEVIVVTAGHRHPMPPTPHFTIRDYTTLSATVLADGQIRVHTVGENAV